MALFALRLASEGHACLIVDLYGTGDSDGEFDEGRWDIWLDDLQRAKDWLIARDLREINLLGIRFGACLATTLARQSATEYTRLLMWQPVIRGKSFMTQFLRLKMVSDMVDSSSQLSTTELREISAGGEPIEVAGYKIRHELLASIDAFDMLDDAPPVGTEVSIFEVTPSAAPRYSLDCQRLVKQWSDAGTNVVSSLIGGHQFWSSTETVVVPELVDATFRAMQREQ